MTAPTDHEPESPEQGGAPAEERVPASLVRAALRGFARNAALVLTALAIVVALALGIPWLIGLVW